MPTTLPSRHQDQAWRSVLVLAGAAVVLAIALLALDHAARPSHHAPNTTHTGGTARAP